MRAMMTLYKCIRLNFKRRNAIVKKSGSLILVLVSVIFSFWLVDRSEKEQLSSLNQALSQVIILGLSLSGSYFFGRQINSDDVKEMMKPHARSAFRRLISILNGLRRIKIAIQLGQSSVGVDAISLGVLSKLDAMLTEHICTASDALEDWHDIVPEQVAELRKYAQRLNSEVGNSNDE